MSSFFDAVIFTTTTTGTGTLTVGSAVAGYRTPYQAGVPDGTTVSYRIDDSNGGWEFGKGTYTSSGTTLSRTSITASSNSNNPITLSGNATVKLVVLAVDLGAGTGGASVVSQSGSLTLTNLSNRSQNVSFTAASQSVTLPDATTISTLGGPVFSIANAGQYIFAVRRNDTTILCVIPPGGAADVYLDANGSAAGTWHHTTLNTISMCGGLKTLENQFSSTYTTLGTSSWRSLRLTDTLSLHFMSSASNTYVVAADSATYPGTVGTPVSIDSVVAGVWAYATSSTTAQIAWMNSTTFNTAVVSVSGTTVTVNTAATKATTAAVSTSTSTPTVQPLVAAAGQYFAFLFKDGSNNLSVLPIYYNGTTSYVGSVQTFGASAVANNLVMACLPIDSTHVLMLYIDDSGSAGSPYSIRGVVGTLSGTTSPAISVGTTAGVNDVITDTDFMVCSHTSSLYTLVYRAQSTNYPTAVGVSISGTTVTFGSAVTVESVAAGFSFSSIGSFTNQSWQVPGLYALTSTTALLSWVQTSLASGQFRNVVITNSAGTISIGTISYGNAPVSTNFSRNTVVPISATSFAILSSSANASAGVFSGSIVMCSISGTSITYIDGLCSAAAGLTYANTADAMCLLSNVTICAKNGEESYAVFAVKNNTAIYVGSVDIPGAGGATVRVTALSASRIAFLYTPGSGRFHSGTASVRLTIVEVPTL